MVLNSSEVGKKRKKGRNENLILLRPKKDLEDSGDTSLRLEARRAAKGPQLSAVHVKI